MKRKTRLKDLVMDTTWRNVEDYIMNYGTPEQKKSIDGYRRVYKQMRRLEPKRKMVYLIITIRKEEWDNEVNYYEDVYGINNRDKEHYALDFTPWEEWLGMMIDERTLMDYKTENIIVDCIWEMTFHGWTQGKVKKGLDRLLRISKECKEHPEKMIPWEDIKKELIDKYDLDFDNE